MKRFTVRMRIIDVWPGVKQAKSMIETEAARSGRYIYVVSVTQSDDRSVWIEIRGEAERTDATTVFKRLEKKLGAKYIAIGWGWPITKNQHVGSDGGIALDTDPYSDATAQSEIVREYAGGWGQIIIYALILPVLVLWLWHMSQNFSNICIVTEALMVCSGFLWVGINLVTGAQCKQDSLVIKYLLRPQKRLQWSEICGMSVRQLGQYCHIETCNRGTSLPIMIPIFHYFGVGDGPMLLRTIAERATLLFVEGSSPPFGVPVYKRLDLEIPDSVRNFEVKYET